MKVNFARILMVMALLLSASVARAAIINSGECGANGDNLTWTLTDDGVLTISGSGAMRNWGAEQSPFFENESVKKVVLSEGVTNIGRWAFGECHGLASIEIPSSVTSIGERAFLGCGLTSVTLPSSLTSIGYWAFFGCEELTSITLPSSLTSIGYWAFFGCEELTSITLPSSLTEIGKDAFEGCI